jgi:hypothetical protein
MPAGLVQQATPMPIDEADLAEVRACLHRIRSDDRPMLWAALDLIRTASITGNVSLLHQVINATEAGTPTRRCVVAIVRRRLAELEERDLRKPVRIAQRFLPQTGTKDVADSSRRFRGVSGCIASEGQWMARPYWWLTHNDLDLAGAQRGGHQPRPLLWSHRPGHPVGLSRAIWIDSDGDVHGSFDFAAYPTAQLAASLAADRAVGFSIGTVGGSRRWLVEVSPDEWDPATGILDLCVQRGALVEEVSLTPTPLVTTTEVRSIW